MKTKELKKRICKHSWRFLTGVPNHGSYITLYCIFCLKIVDKKVLPQTIYE